MYGKNPTFFLLSFVAFQNAFAASETQDHLMIYFIDQVYGTGHWPTYSTSCGLIIFVSVIHSDISPGISETKFMVSQTPLLISENYHWRSYLNFYFLPASIASLFCGRDMLFTWKSDLLLNRRTATWNVFVNTMQPTPSFPRSILTIVKVTGADATLALCCWSASTLRCRSYPNLKEFK